MISRLPGLRPDNLSTYLASLGLMRVVATQGYMDAPTDEGKATPATSCWWEAGVFHLNSDVPDLVDFLVRIYRPSPILSPWNGGSGYGEKDKNQRETLMRVVNSGEPRLAAFARTHTAIQRVRDQTPTTDKGLLVQRLRNLVPDEAVPWLDASVVLTADETGSKVKPAFPPLLGTGGNDGRFDFSTNFQQRLIEVFPELGASTEDSRRWAQAMLAGDSVRLVSATVGQFDPSAAGGPRASAFSAPSLTNPWTFILMIEGMLLFASSVSRRLGERSSRAAMPFTVMAEPSGPLPGSSEEQSRGELWAPLWEQPLVMHDVDHLFASAKTVWNGKTTSRAADMYAALHSRGLDRRVSRIIRFSFLQRNGLAFTAVRLDEIRTKSKPAIRLAIDIQRRAHSFIPSASDASQRELEASHAYRRAYLDFCRAVDNSTLLRLLKAECELEIVASTSISGRDRVERTAHRPSALAVLEVLKEDLWRNSELRLAASLASGQLHYDDEWLTLADLVLGRPPVRTGDKWRSPVVDSFGHVKIHETLAELLVWRLGHYDDTNSVHSAGTTTMDRFSLRSPWSDTHLWARGLADEKTFRESLLAMLALDWSTMFHENDIRRMMCELAPAQCLPSPSLAVIHPFAGGEVIDPDSAANENPRARGINPGWPIKLSYGGRSAVAGVLADATALLNRSLLTMPISGRLSSVACREPEPDIDGARLAAALWAPASSRPLRDIAHAEVVPESR